MKQKNPQKLATSQDISNFKIEFKQELNELREENEQYKDEVLSKLDDISGQLGNLREENIIGAHQASQLRQNVDNHEGRIKNLEKIQHIS